MLKNLFKSRLFLILLCVFLVVFIRRMVNQNRSFYEKDYKFQKVSVSDDESRIFKYTGLSPTAVRDFLESGKEDTVKELNRLYFKKPAIKKNYILFPITAEEKLEKGSTPMAPLKNGDILVTFNTHTLDWRHGHLAIVTDAQSGIALEHMSVGNTSCLSYAKHWGSYPAFAVMRYPDEKIAGKAAKFAKEKLADVPYSIFAGLIDKDKSKNDKIDSSHCSHIVWQAYKAAGVDLDKGGGRIVTPKDVAMSPKLKAVQIFGLNPKDFEKRLMK